MHIAHLAWTVMEHELIQNLVEYFSTSSFIMIDIHEMHNNQRPHSRWENQHKKALQINVYMILDGLTHELNLHGVIRWWEV